MEWQIISDTILVGIVIIVGCIITFSSICKNIEVSAGNPPIGKVTIAYMYGVGGNRRLLHRLREIAPSCDRFLSIYYDDLEKVNVRRGRHVVACILAEGEQEVEMALVKRFEDEGFKLFQLPQVDNVVHASFHFSKIRSLFISDILVHSLMQTFIKDHKLCAHPVLRVHDGSTLHFLAPLSRQGAFYVPEAQQQFEVPVEMYRFSSDEEDSALDYSQEDSALDYSQSNLSASTEYDDSRIDHSGLVSSQLGQGEEEEEEESCPQQPGSDTTQVLEPGSEKKASDSEESTSSFEELMLDLETVGAGDRWDQ